MQTAVKEYPVDFTATAAGDGYWGMEAGTEVKFSKIVVSVLLPEEDYSIVEVRAHHDKDANEFGLCYTDSGIESAVDAFMQSHAELWQVLEAGAVGSEQGMQDANVLSMDANLKYIDRLPEFDFELSD